VRAFIDAHHDRLGVEPICRILQVAPSAYHRYAARQRDPALRSPRALRDDMLRVEIERVWQANQQVYGADKVWRQLRREHIAVARCTVERLMRQLGLRGVSRGSSVCVASAAARRFAPRAPIRRQRVRRTG
jgi:transposase InsO family protein